MDIQISVIVPVYNAEKYILECFSSIINQTKTDRVECIFIDDAGSDQSIEILESNIASYTGNISFTILHHISNKGASGARNTGINAAVGKYVFFLDADDRLSPDCLSILWSYVEKYPNIDLVQGSCVCKIPVFDVNVLGFPSYVSDRKWICSKMLFVDWFPIPPWNKLIRKDLLIFNDCYFKEGIILEDNLWTYNLSKIIHSVAFSRANTYFYRENPNGVMGSFTNTAIAENSIRQIIIEASLHVSSDLCVREQILFIAHWVRMCPNSMRKDFNPLFIVLVSSRIKIEKTSKYSLNGIMPRILYYFSVNILSGMALLNIPLIEKSDLMK